MLRFEAALNGTKFSEIDPAVILLDINEIPAKQTINTVQRGMRAGMRVTSRKRSSLSVRLQYVVREYDIEARARIMDKIAAWVGNGGWLTVNSRPGLRLFVTPDGLPGMGSSLRWTNELSITLTAFAQPYWQQEQPTEVSTTGTGVISPIGTVEEVCAECSAINTGDGVLTALTMTCGNTYIKLERLEVQPGERVEVRYTDDGVLTITAGGKSAMLNRTADSSDDLKARSRVKNIIGVASDQPVTATFAVRGLYL